MTESREKESVKQILTDGLENTTERFAPILLGILLAYTLIRALVAATGKLYWFDELLTKLVVTQKTWADVMSAIRAPVDTQPPLYYLLERLSAALIHNQDLALRAPSAVAMVCTVLCVFCYLRRAYGAKVALLSALFCLLTVQFTYYAQEARPYSLLVACTAFALVCYQRADKMLWVVLLAVTLVLAESLHYLAVLMMVPFGLAEMYRVYVTRSVRWGVWLAMAAGVAALLPSWSILLLNRAYYGANHWTQKFSFMDVSHVYGEFFALTIPIGTAAAATLVLALLTTRKWRTGQQGIDGDEVQETVLVLGLVALPFVGYVFAKATHGGMLARYVLPAIVGLALALGMVLAAVSRRAVFLIGVFIFSALSLRELHFWRFAASDRDIARMETSTTGAFILGAGHTELPVVFQDGNILRMAWPGFPVDQRRLYYLISGEHTMAKGLKNAQHYLPIQVRNQDEFLASNSKFLFFAKGPESGQVLLRDLVKQGWAVELLAGDDLRELYLVYRHP